MIYLYLISKVKYLISLGLFFFRKYRYAAHIYIVIGSVIF